MSAVFRTADAGHKPITRELGQGIKVFHEDRFADVDILAVPGLGTNPEESWTWTSSSKHANKHKQPKRTNAGVATDAGDTNAASSGTREHFNWIRDADGLASLFPRSRIMLYDYASAWRGRFKVRATMKSLCTVLLDDLLEKRKDSIESTRPLLFIGHSMGGVVVAKALCMARARKEYEAIVMSTMGCAFFGVPFKGTEMAKIALLYSSVFGNDAYESLLTFMSTEKKDTLDELREDFVELCRDLKPPIEVFCAWEQIASDVSYTTRLTHKMPGLLKHKFFAAGTRKVTDASLRALGGGTHFVSKESAELEIAHCIGLTADHRGLVQYESVTSAKFAPVHRALRRIVDTAKFNARKRTVLSGQNSLTQTFVNQVRHALEGVDMRSKLRALVARRPVTSWLTSELVYQNWLTSRAEARTKRSHLWLKGGPGFGKTNAALAAIQNIGQTHSDQNPDQGQSRSAPFLAYFLCEKTPGYCSAEDVLKSLMTQLIGQEESLAQHAKWLVADRAHRAGALPGGSSGVPGAQATATVDNLWKYLVDMTDDPAVDSVHFVIVNLHCLDSNESTNAFLSRLGESAAPGQEPRSGSSRAKWLITSRNERQIAKHLNTGLIAVIDLENDREYDAKLKDDRRSHAKNAISQLRERKSYSSDLAYYIRNSIESRSEDEKWVDVLCLLLEEKPDNSSNLSIRKWLSEVAVCNIHDLVESCWNNILSRNDDAKLEIEDLLQVMTIAYEPLTLAELAALTHNDDQRRLADLVRKCSPIFRFGDSSDQRDKVMFTNTEFRERLSIVAHGHDDQQVKQYHGLMALRCFTYIKAVYGSDSSTAPNAHPGASSIVTARVVDDSNVIVLTDKDDELDEADTASSQMLSLSCSYPIKYLIKHLGEGFPDVAQELCDNDPDFWGQKSSLRDAWLADFQRFASDLKDLSANGMSALHVAAGIGATDLVSMLVARNGAAALAWTDEEGMTALHIAALNNHYYVVDELIKIGADVEAGEGQAGTALHLAALHGQCSTMSLLIGSGANVNALRDGYGPVINAAILSGTVEAVKIVMHADVRFDQDYTKCEPPLSLSAGRSEPSLFQDILETGKEKWLQNAQLLDQALVAAAAGGRLESVRILLRFQHEYNNDTLQSAVYSAAVEKKWTLVGELLDNVAGEIVHGTRRDISLNDVFYLAAVSREIQLEVLKKIWYFKSDSIPHDILDFSLYQATVLRKVSTVTWLLDVCHASANATSKPPVFELLGNATVLSSQDFRNAINAAAGIGHLGLVEILLDRGAQIDNDNGLALQLAASEGFVDVVILLLDHKALVDKVIADVPELNLTSGTALQIACENGRVPVVDVLVTHGANPNLGHEHKSPIISATQRSEPDILKILLNAPQIDINVVDSEYQSTPLIYAATNMPAEAVDILIRKGAEINVRNAGGDTALIMAAWKGDRACVEMLCNAGADVTYRNPRRGLAIQVAANELHPECAHVLAERMSGTIADYREEVPVTNAKLRERDNNIETLHSRLLETEEQLEIARKDVASHKFESDRLKAISDFHGETYESIGQQLKMMQHERTELSKQLDAARGQAGLANDTVAKLRGLLKDEQDANASLRKRQGYVALQEEKKEALDLLAQEKESAHKQFELHQQTIRGLDREVELLRQEISEMHGVVELAESATSVVAGERDLERQRREVAEARIEDLQGTVQQMEGVLASVQEAASRNKTKATEERNATNDSGFQEGQSSQNPRRPQAFSTQSDTVILSTISGSPGPIAEESDGAVGQFRSAADALKRRQTDVPASGMSSPTSPTTNGFRTIHGQHRVDGSFGGYRANRQKRQPTNESLYDVSVKGAGEDSPSRESMGRRNGSVASSKGT